MSDIGRIGKQLMITEPFYGFFLLNLNKQFSDSLPTAGVGKQGINQMLYVNPDFWAKLSDNHKIGLLKHELLHIVMFHLTMRHNYMDKKLFNIAADIEINQYIKDEWLPEGALTLTTYNIPLEPKAGTNYYYQELLKNLNSPNPDPLLKQMTGSGAGDIHESWKEFDNLSDAEKKLVQNQVDHILKEAATTINKSRGTIPGELKAKIDELFAVKEAVFNWKAYLRRKIGNSQEIYTKKSRRKPSKRFVDAAGIKVKQKHHILFAKDTSGSVSNAELMEAESELHHIYKAGTRLTVIECDTKINDIYEYKGKYKDYVTGRGGTDFDPVIEYYNKHKSKFTTLVFFTDGYAPINVKPNKPMIWIISSNGKTDTEEFPGYKIKITKNNE